MIIGSNNSMSYLRPQWWLRPFSWIWRHQTKTIDEQLNAGCRAFDLRIAHKSSWGREWDKRWEQGWVFASGWATYKDKQIEDVLIQLNDISRAGIQMGKQPIIVRVILERGNDWDYIPFEEYCRRIDNRYPNLQFCGFRTRNINKFHTHWRRRDKNRCGCGDHGSIKIGGRDWSYSSRPTDGYNLEYELRDFI